MKMGKVIKTIFTVIVYLLLSVAIILVVKDKDVFVFLKGKVSSHQEYKKNSEYRLNEKYKFEAKVRMELSSHKVLAGDNDWRMAYKSDNHIEPEDYCYASEYNYLSVLKNADAIAVVTLDPDNNNLRQKREKMHTLRRSRYENFYDFDYLLTLNKTLKGESKPWIMTKSSWQAEPEFFEWKGEYSPFLAEEDRKYAEVLKTVNLLRIKTGMYHNEHIDTHGESRIAHSPCGSITWESNKIYDIEHVLSCLSSGEETGDCRRRFLSHLLTSDVVYDSSSRDNDKARSLLEKMDKNERMGKYIFQHYHVDIEDQVSFEHSLFKNYKLKMNAQDFTERDVINKIVYQLPFNIKGIQSILHTWIVDADSAKNIDLSFTLPIFTKDGLQYQSFNDCEITRNRRTVSCRYYRQGNPESFSFNQHDFKNAVSNLYGPEYSKPVYTYYDFKEDQMLMYNYLDENLLLPPPESMRPRPPPPSGSKPWVPSWEEMDDTGIYDQYHKKKRRTKRGILYKN